MYVDDTFVIQKEVYKQDFLQHINNVNSASQFTVENKKEDGAIPYLDTIVKPEADGICQSLCTGNLPTWTSTYSGTVTTTSQQNLVLLTPSPIGPKQCVVILSFSEKKWITSGRH